MLNLGSFCRRLDYQCSIAQAHVTIANTAMKRIVQLRLGIIQIVSNSNIVNIVLVQFLMNKQMLRLYVQSRSNNNFGFCGIQKITLFVGLIG